MREATSLVSIAGTARAVPEDASRIGPADPGQRITVTVQVRRDPEAAALPDLNALGALPPKDRPRLDRRVLAASFGADPADLAEVEEFAQGCGLRVMESSPERRTVQLSGTVEQLNRAFAVELNEYRYADGVYRSREGQVHVPHHLDGIVERVSGLTDRPLARPCLRANAAARAGFSATRIAELYTFPTSSAGAGVCIGIIELGGGYSPQDLSTFFADAGVSAPTVVPVAVDGVGNRFGDPDGADVEVELDIEIAGAVAPEAKMAVYFAPNTEQGFIDAVHAAVFDTTNQPSVLSISWGSAEEHWTRAGLDGMNAAFQAAAAAGVTVLAAAGDDGSNDNVDDGQAHCDYPASDPFVLACGGTTLHVDAEGQLTDQTVWHDPQGGATGGGISARFPAQPWQAASRVPSRAGSGRAGRGVPDIAADADPATGYDIVSHGRHTVIGGTSAVSPLYAGLLALIISKTGIPLGYLNPYLYGLAGSKVLVDVRSGDNAVAPAPGYPSGPGWDACTGLGGLNGAALLAAVAGQA